MRFLRFEPRGYKVRGMRERAYPPRLTTEEGIRQVVRDLELKERHRTFSGTSEGKITPMLLESHSREVADWRIEELVEEHGSLTGALHTDSVFLEQLMVFERGNKFLEKLT